MFQGAVFSSVCAYGLLCLGLGIYLLGLVFGRLDEGHTHRSPTWTRMASSAATALAALVWWRGAGRSTPLAGYAALLFVGMLCSFIGDLIMARVIPLKRNVIFGMLTFGAAHVAYLVGYAKAGQALALESPWAWAGGTVGGLALAALLWRALIYDPGSGPLLGYGALGYALLLGAMAGAAMSLAVQEPRFLILAIGALLFLASDAILGNRLFRGSEWFLVGDAVWILYIAGQVLIVSSPAALLWG
jgi:hypothetical protein